MIKRPVEFSNDVKESRNGFQALHGDRCGYLFVSNALDNVFDPLFVREGERASGQDIQLCE